MENMSYGEVTPEWLNALESKYVRVARKEVKARERAGFAVTPEWLDALERKHQALAMQEIASRRLLREGEKMNPLKWLFRKCGVASRSVLPTDQGGGSTALVVYDPQFVYGSVGNVERLTHLLDVLRFERSVDAINSFVAFLDWKLETGQDDQVLLLDKTRQFVCVYLEGEADMLVDDLVVVGEDMLELF